MPGVSSQKAKEILSHGKVRGKKLSSSQKGYFGVVAGGKRPKVDVRKAAVQRASA